MSATLGIAAREIRAYFSSPGSYLVLAFFALAFGWFFWALLTLFSQASLAGGDSLDPETMVNVNQQMIRPLLQNASLVLLFVLPMLTMRMFAEEKRSGTIELLMTAPLSDTQIVIGKFLGAIAVYSFMLVLTFVHVGVLFFIGRPELGPLIAGYLGLLLFGACLISIGLLISSLTASQMVAGTVTFVLFLLVWATSWVSDLGGPWVQQILSHVSIMGQFDDFARGTVVSKHLVSQLSVIGFGLFLTKASLEVSRSKK